jgi:hypothetical protein
MMDAHGSGMSNLIVEVFREANEHLRESDRKRDILLGSYLAVVGIGAGWVVNALLKIENLTNLSSLSYFVLGALLLVGLPVLRAVIVYRGWHSHYANVCKAVQWSLTHNLNLYEAACKLIEDRSNRYEFFSRRGVEFMMYLFILVLWGILLASLLEMVLLFKFSFLLWSASLISGLVLVAVLVLGIWYYRRYLLLQQKRFPNDSWMIIQPTTEAPPENDQ